MVSLYGVFKEKGASARDHEEDCWSFEALTPNLNPRVYQTLSLSKESLSKKLFL
jgi:hypothetical protein